MVAGELVALLAMVTLPVTAPAAVGANSTVTGIDWLGVRVSPEVTPLTVKPAPVMLTLETVTSEFPVLVRETLI
jgi:hypothetical protein